MLNWRETFHLAAIAFIAGLAAIAVFLVAVR